MITRKMIQTNKDLAISLHREMWNWLANNPDKYKRNWPRWEINGGDVELCEFLCFACEYIIKSESEFALCRKSGCLFKWPSIAERVECINLKKGPDGKGLFSLYIGAIDELLYIDGDCSEEEIYNLRKKISQLARAIANLPVNEEV